MKSKYLLLLIVFSFSSFALACASTSSQVKAQQDLRAVDYWPLQLGNQWTYRIEHGGATQKNTVKIIRQDSDGFFIDNQGARLKAHPAGIFDGDRFLLRDPLELGAKWMAVPSANALEHFEITSVHFDMSVPAGEFHNCVRVQARNKISAKESFIGEWTYAPGVGLIAFESFRQVAAKEPQPQTKMQLVEYKIADKNKSAH